MTNSYKKHLNHFFEKLLYYRHISGRINDVFQKDIKIHTNEGAIIAFGSALAISDWTGQTDKGWEVNFHTGIVTETTKSNYELEMRKIYSKQLCLLYAQSFEALERFVKDCLFIRIGCDDAIREYTISLLLKNQLPSITREKMPGGGNLFKILKKAGGETFKKFTLKNNLNIKFSELWTVLSEVRHSITHKESLIESRLIKQTRHHTEIFKLLFNSEDESTDLLSIQLDYDKFTSLIKRFSEFAYQVFKILSIEEKLEWEDNK